MNTEDFEKRLQGQVLRQPPAAWREEILTAARSRIPDPNAAAGSQLPAGWRLLWSRFPVAWGAVAAMWLVIIGVNSLMSGPAVTMIVSSPAPMPPEAMTVWNLQRADFGLLANQQTDTPVLAPSPRQRMTPPPRSDLRREEGFGECGARRQFTTIA
jgi:hypothetical protein